MRKKLVTSHEEENQVNEAMAISAIQTNPKYFYTYAKSKSKIKAKIGPLIKNGETIDCPRQIAEILREQYESVFSPPSHENIVRDAHSFFSEPNTLNQASCQTIQFEEADIKEAIKGLKNNSAAGPDNIPTILLKECVNELATPLCILWKQSLQCGTIPDDLKKSPYNSHLQGRHKKSTEKL